MHIMIQEDALTAE